MVLSYERKLRRHKEYKKQICDGKGRIMEKHKHERSTFSGKIGFVLSAAGASVGLGNICRDSSGTYDKEKSGRCVWNFW